MMHDVMCLFRFICYYLSLSLSSSSALHDELANAIKILFPTLRLNFSQIVIKCNQLEMKMTIIVTHNGGIILQ